MIYLSAKDIDKLGVNWEETVDVIENTVKCLEKLDFVQPIKPYLRYRDLKNRIIAMPAFVGGDSDVAGIKWIASFPENIHRNISRSHSVVILNDSETGVPLTVINAPLLSTIRTASVSGVILKEFDRIRKPKKINLGIIGWGPIGQYHYKLCSSIFQDRIEKIFLYDKRPIVDVEDSILAPHKGNVVVCDGWEEAYEAADVFITGTVSNAPYINKKPKRGSFHLNVSLRDYKVDVYEHFKNAIIVDDWDEVCREKTDIEMMHIEKGLISENTKSIVDVVCNKCLNNYEKSQPIMFNPMGMAVFDIAIGAYYLNKARMSNIGVELK